MLQIYLRMLIYLVSSGLCVTTKNNNSSLLLSNEVKPQIECTNPNIKFYLYTRITNEYELNSESIQNASFVLDAPIKLLIHGYKGTSNGFVDDNLSPEYFKLRDLNVISVDFRSLVTSYFKAVYRTPRIGEFIGIFLLNLFKARMDLKLENLHVIGFSLGSHVAGYAGRYMQLHSKIIPRITALDPAAPLFIFDNKGFKKSDANFVDVVHTNIGLNGKFSPLGHLDFYANDGVYQPGCKKNSMCSHMRSVIYFAESINGKTKFLALNCSTYKSFQEQRNNFNYEKTVIVMGEHVDKTQHGVYYFGTNSCAPYAQGRGSFNIQLHYLL